ncbi:MAG: RNA polymerase sigma factor [Burkholderiales bacterium]
MRAGEGGERDGCAGAAPVFRLRSAVDPTAAGAQTPRPMRDAGEASDEALMSAYRDGDGQAFQVLYARHRGGLYRFLLRQCGAAAIAEELFQDVWLNLIRARLRYAPAARFATYLYRIAHNRLIDHYRRAAHRPTLASDDADDDPVANLAADSRQQPDIRLQRKAQVERFMELLAGLPDAQREAFVMHEEAGLSIEEIARATGVNAETAKSRLRYALAKLRRGLQELL